MILFLFTTLTIYFGRQKNRLIELIEKSQDKIDYGLLSGGLKTVNNNIVELTLNGVLDMISAVT